VFAPTSDQYCTVALNDLRFVFAGTHTLARGSRSRRRPRMNIGGSLDEREARFQWSQLNMHAPGAMCKCTVVDGVKGTKVTRIRSTKLENGRFECVEMLKFVPFEELLAGEKRMACQGLAQNSSGRWVVKE
jgi:hypothetical protein